MSNDHTLLEQRIRERAHQLWEEAGSPQESDQHFWFVAKRELDRQEAQLDQEVADSFPASDPPSSSVITGATGQIAAPPGGGEASNSGTPAAIDAAPVKRAKRRAK
ncbi:DUF2934 domain-containing protein [Plastoroseomonas hellenica]|uniref:DUF2934 domain-containing protein n=1 Tax=Plastoroseomonas hellenica TaxID=2687306 RepID=UPI001BA5EEAE|nr:DUF2934 domain-containing protein [Plastoroseomonas hellenica]MBR0641402.1 DUF2934 domain-containing protein [Plastoroseomonas hellenica]